MIISLSRSVVDLWGRRTIVREEQERLAQLQKRNQELKEKKQFVETTTFIEQEARDRLGMAREGETVILMDTGNTVESKGHTVIHSPSDQTSNWKRWWQIFF